jgi:hypothetical protein
MGLGSKLFEFNGVTEWIFFDYSNKRILAVIHCSCSYSPVPLVIIISGDQHGNHREFEPTELGSEKGYVSWFSRK